MLGLPKTTEVRQALPKAQIYKKFGLKASQRDAFDADVSSMEIVNAIIPQTLPAIAAGERVKGVFVVEVALKNHEYNEKNIALIAKIIPQKLIFALRYGKSFQLAVFNERFFLSPWYDDERYAPQLLESAINLDGVWENIVAKIGNLTLEAGCNLSAAIEHDQQRKMLTSRIEQLTRKMRATCQNHRQLEIFSEIKRTKAQLKELENNK